MVINNICNEEVSRNIKATRTRSGLTQSEAANQLGLTRQNYSKWENKPFSLSINKLKSMADVFGCQIADFFRQ